MRASRPATAAQVHVEIEGVDAIRDEMREVVEELWPELTHKLPPKRPQG